MQQQREQQQQAAKVEKTASGAAAKAAKAAAGAAAKEPPITSGTRPDHPVQVIIGEWIMLFRLILLYRRKVSSLNAVRELLSN